MDLTLVHSGPAIERAQICESLEKSGVSFEVQPEIRNARGQYLLVVESGRSIDPEPLQKMWAKRGEAEMVLASRYLRGGGSELSPIASLATRLANRGLRQALRVPIHDLLSGIGLYQASAIEEIGEEAGEGAAPLELLVRLHNLGFKTREVAYHERGRRRLSRILGEAIRHFRSLPRLRRLRRSPEAADADDLSFTRGILWRRRRRRLEERQRTIVSFLEVDVPVLDVGCGSGRLVQSLSKATGLDRDRRKLRFLRGRARTTVQGQLQRLPFRDGSFPQIVCSDVIGGLAPDVPFLPELRRVLGYRGTLVLATPVKGSKIRHTESELREELQKTGFAVDEVRKLRGRELVFRAVRRELEPPTHQDRGSRAGAS